LTASRLNLFLRKTYRPLTVSKWIVVLVCWSVRTSYGQTVSPCKRQNMGSPSEVWIVPEMPKNFWGPEGVLKKVRDGLALTIDRQVARSVGSSLQIIIDRRCRLTYDLWAEVFLLNRFESQRGQLEKIASPDEALAKCVGWPQVQTMQGVIQYRVTVNPVDKSQEERTRTWLAQKGIGGTGIISRAINAVMDLKADSVVENACQL
jgi:hypothetical protein